MVLNPFFRVPGFSPETAAYGPIHVGETAIPEMLKLVDSPVEPRPNAAPEDFENIVKSTGQSVRWDEVRQAIDAPPGIDFLRTVWLWTVKVGRQDQNARIAEDLTRYCRETGTYPPEEDQLPAVLEPALGRYLTSLGLASATLWGEWREASVDVPVSSFEANAPASEVPRAKCSAVSAPGVLLCWEFDDVAGLLALTDARLSQADPAEVFEVLPVTPGMCSDVFNPPDGEPRSRPSRQ